MFTYLEGADHVAGQLHGDKECPFSGVTKSGRVWRKVPESDARSVYHTMNRTLLSASFWLVDLFIFYLYFSLLFFSLFFTIHKRCHGGYCVLGWYCFECSFFLSFDGYFFSSSFYLKRKGFVLQIFVESDLKWCSDWWCVWFRCTFVAVSSSAVFRVVMAVVEVTVVAVRLDRIWNQLWYSVFLEVSL